MNLQQRQDGRRRAQQKGSWLLSTTLSSFHCPGAVQLVFCAWSRWGTTGLILFFLMLWLTWALVCVICWPWLNSKDWEDIRNETSCKSVDSPVWSGPWLRAWEKQLFLFDIFHKHMAVFLEPFSVCITLCRKELVLWWGKGIICQAMKLVANPSWLRRKLWVLPWLTAIQLALSPITDARHTQTTKLGMQWHLSNAWTALFGTAFSLILPCPAFTAGWKEIFSCYFCKTDLVQWTGEVMIKAGLVLTDERVQAWACKYLELPWCIGKGKPKYSHCLIHTLGKIWPIIVKMFSTILHGWFFF